MFGKSIFRSYSSFVNLFSRFSDPLIVVLAAIISYGLRFSFVDMDLPQDYRLLILSSLFCVALVFPVFNIYSSWRGQGLFRQAQSIFMAWISVILLMIVILFVLKVSISYSRLWLVWWSILGLLLLITVRLFVYAFLQFQRKRGRNLRHVVIAGSGDLGKNVLLKIKESPWTGYKIKALFDDRASERVALIEGYSVKGKISDVAQYVSENKIDEVWIALPLRAEKRVKELLYDLRHNTVNIKLIPDIFGFSLLNHSMTEIAGLPAVNLSESPMEGFNRVIKAVEDRVVALVILLMIAPLLVIIAIGVKISSPGPVFFRQKRLSWNGTVFQMFKFRSMPVDDGKSELVWGNVKEKKTTKFGKFLRRTSLDELPQFFNVLLGHMSIVGPRPERPEFVDKFKNEIPGYMQKHMVKAGITGWAQINGWRGDTCLKTRIEHDLYYIENWSLWFDIKIILLTVFKGFLNKNAY